MQTSMIDKPRCSNCNSDQVYIRFKTLEKVCRHCGYIEQMEVKENEDL